MTKKNEVKVVVAMCIASGVTSMIAGKTIEKKVNEKYANMRFTSFSEAALMQSIAQNELEMQACNLCENMEYFEYDKRVAEYVPVGYEPLSEEELAAMDAFIATL